MAYTHSGTQSKFRPIETRRDIRRLDIKINEALHGVEGSTYILMINGAVSFATFLFPFGGELALAGSYLLRSIYGFPEKRVHDFPWRVPKHAKLFDGSNNLELLNEMHKGNVLKIAPHKMYGEGVTYYGVCRETKMPVYATNSDDRTHTICLGTTGSGKTEFLLGGVANQLVQNSGLIYVDAKGDPALQLQISRLTRRFLRDDDILTINFITSGRNVARAQPDKITNTFNMMADTSEGMLTELLNNLLDDSGGGGGDMWKGRALTFIAALTRVLTYLRDQGVLQLSPKTYTQYLELSALEELVFEHNGKYGELFASAASALSMYLTTLPGYNTSPKARKKQDQKTVEQHGYIVMQLTRAINYLTYDYGYIFGTQQGDIDIFDCVLNRRIVTIPLPALERSPASLAMLGKLCIGSIKQMMAASLGNRIEGLVREIIDSRPTNSPNAYRLIFDEVGYIIVSGVSVMPAQGRSLSFAMSFAAQDFADIKRANDNEAEAVWGNTNVKALGKLAAGDNGATMDKVNGMTGEEYQARVTTTELKSGDLGDKYTPSASTHIQKERVLTFDDLGGQEKGEFTLIVSKKESGGATAGVKVIRMLAFYVAGEPLKYLRMNDLCPNFSIPKDRLSSPNTRLDRISNLLKDDHKRNTIGEGNNLDHSDTFKHLRELKTDVFYSQDPIMCLKAFLKTKLNEVLSNDISLVGSHNTNKADALFGDQPDFHEEDDNQSEQSLSLHIGDAVRRSPKYESELHSIITDGAESVDKDNPLDINVKSSLDNSLVEPINIFKLLSYAKECEQRLRQHDIQLLDSVTNYGILPFVPSHASDLNDDHHELNARLIEFDKRNLKTKSVGKNVSDLGAELYNELGFEATKTATDIGFSVDAPKVIDKRDRMDQLLRLAIKAKGQIKISEN